MLIGAPFKGLPPTTEFRLVGFIKGNFRRRHLLAAFIALWILPLSAKSDTVTFDGPLVGLDEFKAIEKIEAKGLTYDIRRVDDCGVPGSVTETIPQIEAGTSVSSDEEITLLITTKTGTTTVPDVSNLTLQQATKDLHDACFKVVPALRTPAAILEMMTCAVSQKVFEANGGVQDKVIDTSPKHGETVPWASEVKVYRYRDGKYKETLSFISGVFNCP